MTFEELARTLRTRLWLWWAIAAVVVALAALTSPWRSTLVFLVVPVAGAAWWGGARAGAVTAVGCTVAGVLVGWLTHDVTDAALLAWDAMPRAVVYGIVVVGAARQCELLQQQSRLAAIDPLTGALNRGAFLSRLEDELSRARRHGHELALLYLDVDDLKIINDTEGHEAGDRHLSALVETAAGVLRRHDLVGRLGGDEFAILLPETGESDAERLADRLRRALTDSTEHRPVYVSIGLVAVREVPEDTDELLRRADALMYVAKRSGSGISRQSRLHEADDSSSAIVSAQSSREANDASST